MFIISRLLTNKNRVLMALFLLIFMIISCTNPQKRQEARLKADKLIEKIASGNANQDFSEKYFSKDFIGRILKDLKDFCDFKNRKGHFINDFYQKGPNYDRVSFIYEYYLKCDSIRFIISYDITNEINLVAFQLEGIEKDNPMIIYPEKRLPVKKD